MERPAPPHLRRAAGRFAPLWAGLLTFAGVTALVGGVLHLREPAPSDIDPAGATPHVSVQVVQLRRDEVLDRVELAVTNHGPGAVVVTGVRLDMDGFTGGGWVPKDSPVPEGQVVDLPTPYGEARCPSDGVPNLGRVTVRLRLHGAASAQPRMVRIMPTASRPLLRRVLGSLCVAKRLAAEVSLSFGRRWQRTGHGAGTALHTTIEAALTPGTPPRDVTQVFGTVIYDLAAAGGGSPLARLRPARPTSSIPVVITRSRCTAHAKGETKQPYRFLVWVGEPGSQGQAADLPVRESDRVRLRAVCAF